MAAVVGLVGILILAWLYVVASGAVLVFVATPLTLVGLPAGVLAGLVLGSQRALTVFAGRMPGAPVRTPADVVAGKIAGRVRVGSVRRDRAWPQYFTAQVRLDLATVARSTGSAVGTAWAWMGRPLTRPEHRWVTLACWPILLPVPFVLIGLSVGAAALVAVTSLVLAVASTVAWSVGLVTVGVLRVADRGWQLVFRASASCPGGFHVTRLPAYRCAGPHSEADRQQGHDLHRDIRPGRLGVLWRRCACGRRLPTTLLRAARQLEARCPVCVEPLHEGAGVATDIRIPVFGAASAGKTHLIMAGLVSLFRTGAQRGIAIGLLDERSRAACVEYRDLVDSGQSAPKTSAATPVAVTVRLRTGRRTALVHFFDAAGEVLVDPAQNSELAYLDYARTLTFVLDPFSIADVREQARVGYPDTLREANAATYDPEDSYQTTVNRLRLYSVDTQRQRLAFVLSKADLLARLPIAAELVAGTQSVRDWLDKVGLDNLVTAATRDFATVEFFLVSAKDLSPDGAFAPFRWLLAAERMSV